MSANSDASDYEKAALRSMILGYDRSDIQTSPSEDIRGAANMMWTATSLPS